jgi:hypothetical protein
MKKNKWKSKDSARLYDRIYGFSGFLGCIDYYIDLKNEINFESHCRRRKAREEKTILEKISDIRAF